MARRTEPAAIRIVGAAEHNLQRINLTLPRNTLTVFTGVSGSGKSSLAFDTLFKEGQRRFLESLSPYARQFLGPMEKPRVDLVSGLSPTISIDQKTVNRNPRSTVGTMTELYDHYRLLMARLGTPYCPNCKILISTLTPQRIARSVIGESARSAAAERPFVSILAPMVRGRKGEYRRELATWSDEGYLRIRVNGVLRRLDEEIVLQRYEKHTLELVLDRIRLGPESEARLSEAVERAIALSGGLVNICVEDTERLYSSSMACPQCQMAVPELEPRLFSFNDLQGACPECHGIGIQQRFSETRLIYPERSLATGALACCNEDGRILFTPLGPQLLASLARALGIDPRTPWNALPVAQRKLFLHGDGCSAPRPRVVFRAPRLLLEAVQRGAGWPGILGVLETVRRYVGSTMERFQEVSTCSTCRGQRLNTVALAVRFRDHNIATLAECTISEALEFFKGLRLSAQEQLIGKDLFRETCNRLQFLEQVGVGYLSISRRANTLSGGEAQRIRLAAQIGSGLQGVLYILDEPSIGLHPTDNRKLIAALRHLRDGGNTVHVVEHDQETVESADHLVELGPGAGEQGGRLIAQGTPQQVLSNARSLTAHCLRGAGRIPTPSARRPRGKDCIVIRKAKLYNLKALDLNLPMGLLVAVSGVSGSGKSTLIHGVLKTLLRNHLARLPLPIGAQGLCETVEGLSQVHRLIEIDQSPIGRTPRSNPATYTKALDPIRQLFSLTPQARVRGYKPGRFSFNVPGGRCEECHGAGVRVIEMQFLSNVEVPCEECQERRFNTETLEIRYGGRNIHEVLGLSVAEAGRAFANVPNVARILDTLNAVGLGYVRLGQPSTTLSGGEAQRVKLASELCKRSSNPAIYLLDEPTTGLHVEDIRALLRCLNSLVDQGHTVIVIEHNLDVIKVADWIVDLGPGGGNAGGELVAEGTPEEVACNSRSLTGQALAEALKQRAPVPLAHDRPRLHPTARSIEVRGAEQHNLKHIDVKIPHNRLTVITGVSGSGKTSLAFDTLFAEGQARYVESLSTYARRFLGRFDKARVEQISGLAPAIAIDQRNSGRSPRSTVATVTEIQDSLRLLYARIGKPHCPVCDQFLEGYSPSRLAQQLSQEDAGNMLRICAPQPLEVHSADIWRAQAAAWMQQGFLRASFRLAGAATQLWKLEDPLPAALDPSPSAKKAKTLESFSLVIDRLRATATSRKRIAEAVESAYRESQGRVEIHLEDVPTDDPRAIREFGALPACTKHDYVLQEPFNPRQFSFNSHHGACPHCEGLGKTLQAHPDLLLPFPELPLFEGALVKGALRRYLTHPHSDPRRRIERYARRRKIPLEQPFGALSAEQKQALLYGDRPPRRGKFPGLSQFVSDWYRQLWSAESAAPPPVFAQLPCPACAGERLQPRFRAVRLQGENISRFCARTVTEALLWVSEWKLNAQDHLVALQPLAEIRNRLGFLRDVGLGYLTLDRDASTLSGGEAQRIRLASQLGAQLVGVLYVLDEPTIGLHARDIARLLHTLQRMRDGGNTVVVVEHDADTIRAADYLIDMGPHAGAQGGTVVAQGTPPQVARQRNSLTGDYLSGRKSMPTPSVRRSGEDKAAIIVRGAKANNLQGIDVRFPLGILNVVTGVSGSGKSSLVLSVLKQALARHLHDARVLPGAYESLEGAEQIEKLVAVDQSSIGKTPRSNPATYTGAMDYIRRLFAATPIARARGFAPGRFSAFSKGGRCEHCEGLGSRHVEMHFLADVWMLCTECEGRRFNRATLEVRFKERNIIEVLEMEIAQAVEFFAQQRSLQRILGALNEVGLGYMRLGQPANTLSGGEAQRVKLAAELGRPTQGRSLYILDEPTRGLHFEDIARLLNVLHRLVDQGNTVILIEHNLDVIRSADHVIDLGPEGGEAGGQLVAEGPPEAIARNPASHTGRALAARKDPSSMRSPKASKAAAADSAPDAAANDAAADNTAVNNAAANDAAVNNTAAAKSAANNTTKPRSSGKIVSVDAPSAV